MTEAIILRSRTMKENDIWIDFLSPTHGRLHGIARHGRKSQKRFGTVLEPLNFVALRYKEMPGLVSLEEASLTEPILNLEKDASKLLIGFYFLDLLRHFIPEGHKEPKVYELLKEAFFLLNQAEDPHAIVAKFEFRLLQLCGLAPQVKACLACGKARAGGEASFVYREGSVFCRDCLPTGLVSEPLTRESWPRILHKFIEYQLGQPLKSRKFLTYFDFCG